MTEQKGGIAIPVFYCVFHGHESITSFKAQFDLDAYKELPNLYAVCLSDNSGSQRNIVGGFYVKTSYTHEDREFLDVITEIARSRKELREFVGTESTFLPARLTVAGNDPLSEDEMLRIMLQQLFKFSAAGTA